MQSSSNTASIYMIKPSENHLQTHTHYSSSSSLIPRQNQPWRRFRTDFQQREGRLLWSTTNTESGSVMKHWITNDQTVIVLLCCDPNWPAGSDTHSSLPVPNVFIWSLFYSVSSSCSCRFSSHRVNMFCFIHKHHMWRSRSGDHVTSEWPVRSVTGHGSPTEQKMF